MTIKDVENSVTATSLCKTSKYERPNSKSIPYPSPPNSPSQATGVSGEQAWPVTDLFSPPLSLPPTPSRQSTAPRVYDKQAPEETTDAATLRTRLDIDGERCGAFTKTPGRPCQCWSPALNRAAVTS